MGKINNVNTPGLTGYSVKKSATGSTPAGSTQSTPGGPDAFDGPGLFRLETASTPAGSTPLGSTLATSTAPGSTPVGTSHVPTTSATPTTRSTEADILYTMASYGNFELLAGGDGDKTSISKEEIHAQLEKDTAAIKDGSVWNMSGTDAGLLFRRRYALEEMEKDFGKYAKNGKLDLPTLQKAYTNATGAPNASPSLTPEQQDTLQPLMTNDGKASDMFNQIAGADPKSDNGNTSSISTGDLQAMANKANSPNPKEAAAADTAKKILGDQQLMDALTKKPGGVFTEGGGFTIDDIRRLLGQS